MNLKNRTLVFDAQSMRFDDWNGHLRVKKSNLTKANVCEYYGFEINNCKKYGLDPERKYRFLRSPEALKQAVSSFKERPILYVHKAADADQLDNSKVIGTTGSDPHFNAPYIQSSITIWDGDYIDAIKNKTQSELSASYAFTPVMKKGEFNGESYDGVMTNIYVDHIALVAEGRAGSDVRVADEKVIKRMPNLNQVGLKLVHILTRLLNQGDYPQINKETVTDAVANVNGNKRKHVPLLLKTLLTDHTRQNHAGAVDAENMDHILAKAMDELTDTTTIDDEDFMDTVDVGDQKGKIKGDQVVEDCDCNKASDSRSRASDAKTLERVIERRIMVKANQIQEAKLLVKPLVGQWANTDDSGEEILRSVLTELTGKAPPADIGYETLKYIVDLIHAQKGSLMAHDSKPVKSNDMQRFGATRLRSI